MLMCLGQEMLACPDEKAEQQHGSELETPTDAPLLGIYPSADTHMHTWGHTRTHEMSASTAWQKHVMFQCPSGVVGLSKPEHIHEKEAFTAA